VQNERIGILLIHGIGDQRQNEFLQTTAEHFVKTAAIGLGSGNLNVEMFPGLNREAPLSIMVNDGGKVSRFDFHELWWRDLGESPKFRAKIKFWLWALSLGGTRGYFPRSSERTSKIFPSNLSTRFGFILPHDRIVLFLKTTYFFVLLAPLLLVFDLAAHIPGVSRFSLVRATFTYLSSVQMYQERRSRQGGTLVDFDQSRRISIQRRFVNAVIEMAMRDYDRWYIMAHSLGSVIAFQGLMLDKHAMARLVTANRWTHCDFQKFKAAPSSPDRDYPDEPKCPLWLSSSDGLDQKAIFAKLRGLITYGSPIETFARTWPAIVHIDPDATIVGPKLPDEFEWLNIYDPVDVVASKITSFGVSKPDERGVMKPKNLCFRSSKFILAAHTSYLKPKTANLYHKAVPALFRWVMHPEAPFCVDSQGEGSLVDRGESNRRKVWAIFQWAFVLVLGLVIWPYSLIVVARPILSMAGTFLFFDPSLSKRVLDLWENLRDLITDFEMSTDCVADLWHAFIILGVVTGVLIIAGALHFFIDVYLDKKTSMITLTSRKPVIKV
jgi:hypothetical protein